MFDDLRGLIQKLDELGHLTKVVGADWDLEMGTINELMVEHKKPILLFDKVKGYREGYRIVTNIFRTGIALRLSLGIPEGLSDVDVIRYWKDTCEQYKPVPPIEVKSGPVMENILMGEEINILTFPAPKWHEKDGGRYIGTGTAIITRDAEEGWLNVGTYRVMVHDERTLGFYVSPGKHGATMREKYWAKGESCPVVMCFGQEPLLSAAASMNIPWGTSEFDFVGYVKGRPIEVIKGEITGLPIPATAEIAIEGFSPPPSVDSRNEGPFGEWSGYYASGARDEPVVHIKAIYHRSNPIMLAMPAIEPGGCGTYALPIHTASPLWSALEKSGMQGVRGVWVHGTSNRIVVVVSIQQRYLGHAKQIATQAASLIQGEGGTGRYIVVVDDDIDPANPREVMWAIYSRCDPETSIDIIRGYLSSPIDPVIPPEKRSRRDFTQTRVIMNACKPYHWMKEFPPPNRASDELRKQVADKWSHLFT